MSASRILTHPLLWTAVAFAVLPFVAGANPFIGQGGFVDIATTMLCFALFASGFNLFSVTSASCRSAMQCSSRLRRTRRHCTRRASM